MPRQSSQPDDAKIAANLRRAIELTELGLALRRSVIQQQEPQGDAMVQVMREICRTKERAWQRDRSYLRRPPGFIADFNRWERLGA
jgi:hypothetical protein